MFFKPGAGFSHFFVIIFFIMSFHCQEKIHYILTASLPLPTNFETRNYQTIGKISAFVKTFSFSGISSGFHHEIYGFTFVNSTYIAEAHAATN